MKWMGKKSVQKGQGRKKWERFIVVIRLVLDGKYWIYGIQD